MSYDHGGGGGGSGWKGYVRAATQYAASSIQAEAAREPGTRRKRLMQAASDLRQSYSTGYYSNPSEGGQPELGTVTNGEQHLWLFPSYARIIDPVDSRGNLRDSDYQYSSDASKSPHHSNLEDDSADNLIEVNVRGWLFQRPVGPRGRKERAQISFLRWMCGLPQGQGEQPTREETDEVVSEIEHVAAQPGNEGAPGGSVMERILQWRSSSTDTALPTRTPAELRSADTTFAERLAPFTHRPVPNAPVTVFFYDANNDTQGKRYDVYTSTDGHLLLQTRLPFIPTHVRVLASEDLSALEEIQIYTPEGVSIISDIDDTVKHSALSMGAREALRVTFTAPVQEFIIPGVSEWYKALTAPPCSVNVHYISNSPWQLYPVLRSFFDESGLPPGSFHLKHYSGVLSGITEPPAERKRGAVERVIKDFPHRKWLLIGDSNEADLEVYTEMAERWPNRVLAICIRDITSNPKLRNPSFFTQSTPSNVSHPSLPLHPRSIPISSLNSSTSTLNNITNPSSTPPARPEKPASLRGPPIPRKPVPRNPVNLQHTPGTPDPDSHTQHAGIGPEGREYTLPRRKTASSQHEDIHTAAPPRNRLHRVNTAAPTTNPFQDPQTAAPPRAPILHRMATATGAVGVGADLPPLTKRQMNWEIRWAEARERLDRRNIRLLYWRVGTDLKDVTVEIVEKELKRQKAMKVRRNG